MKFIIILTFCAINLFLGEQNIFLFLKKLSLLPIILSKFFKNTKFNTKNWFIRTEQIWFQSADRQNKAVI